MTSSVGIDISSFQSSIPAGDWLFVVHKATEGIDYHDPSFASRYPAMRGAAPYIGAYHYARPLDGHSAVDQANFFAQTVLAAGFRPGVDLWQLDCEGAGNEGTSDTQWVDFVNAFFVEATAKLGNRGFLYVGHYFNAGLSSLVTKFPWWDPDYGVNDGAVHALPVGATPVIHQYTSRPFDKNVISDTAAWNRIVGTHPTEKVVPMYHIDIKDGVADLKCPTGGAWLLQDDGGIFTFGGAPFQGSMVNNPAWKLPDGTPRHGARLTLERYGFLNRKFRYVIWATDGASYRPTLP